MKKLTERPWSTGATLVVLAVVVGMPLGCTQNRLDVDPTPGWPTASPAARGLDAAPLEALDAAIRADSFGYIDRLFVVHDGHVVIDERYPRDYVAASRDLDLTPHQFNYTHPDYHPFFRGGTAHSLQSVTKSVTSALIGIAIGRGEISGVDARLVDFLGDYDLSGTDPRFRDATLEDLLEMRTGIEWHESDRPAGPGNTTFDMELEDDWVRYTLAQPMDAAPAEKWVYNSGTSHLMSAVILSATGMKATEYAERYLFGPLGISDYHWKITNAGLPDTEGGLYLEAADLAKIGYLFLEDGIWEDRRILPAGWVEASTARRVDPVNDGGWAYGYQWWRVDRNGVVVWAGLGYGGQFLMVMPELDLVGVLNSWNLFGGSQAGILMPFLDAMIAAGGG